VRLSRSVARWPPPPIERDALAPRRADADVSMTTRTETWLPFGVLLMAQEHGETATSSVGDAPERSWSASARARMMMIPIQKTALGAGFHDLHPHNKVRNRT
jgi:hypothetical protein